MVRETLKRLFRRGGGTAAPAAVAGPGVGAVGAGPGMPAHAPVAAPALAAHGGPATGWRNAGALGARRGGVMLGDRQPHPAAAPPPVPARPPRAAASAASAAPAAAAPVPFGTLTPPDAAPPPVPVVAVAPAPDDDMPALGPAPVSASSAALAPLFMLAPSATAPSPVPAAAPAPDDDMPPPLGPAPAAAAAAHVPLGTLAPPATAPPPVPAVVPAPDDDMPPLGPAPPAAAAPPVVSAEANRLAKPALGMSYDRYLELKDAVAAIRAGLPTTAMATFKRFAEEIAALSAEDYASWLRHCDATHPGAVAAAAAAAAAEAAARAAAAAAAADAQAMVDRYEAHADELAFATRNAGILLRRGIPKQNRMNQEDYDTLIQAYDDDVERAKDEVKRKGVALLRELWVIRRSHPDAFGYLAVDADTVPQPTSVPWVESGFDSAPQPVVGPGGFQAGMSPSKWASAEAGFLSKNAAVQDVTGMLAHVEGHKKSYLQRWGEAGAARKVLTAGKLAVHQLSLAGSRGRFAHEGKLNPAAMSQSVADPANAGELASFDPFAELAEAPATASQSQKDLTGALRQQVKHTAVRINALDPDEEHVYAGADDNTEAALRKAYSRGQPPGMEVAPFGMDAAYKSFAEDDDENAYSQERMDAGEKADALRKPDDMKYRFQLVVNVPTEAYLDIQDEVTKRKISLRKKAQITKNEGESDSDYTQRRQQFFDAKFMGQIRQGSGYKALLERRRAEAGEGFSEGDDPVLDAYITDQYQISRGSTRGAEGHVFVRLKRLGSGNKVYSQHSFGYWPLTPLVDPGDVVAGRVKNPDTHTYEGDSGNNSVLEDRDVSNSSAVNAVAYIRSVIGSARSYSFAGYNCTSFGVEAAQAAGISPGASFSREITATGRNMRVDSPTAIARSYKVYEHRAADVEMREKMSDSDIVEMAWRDKEKSPLYEEIMAVFYRKADKHTADGVARQVFLEMPRWVSSLAAKKEAAITLRQASSRTMLHNALTTRSGLVALFAGEFSEERMELGVKRMIALVGKKIVRAAAAPAIAAAAPPPAAAP